MVIAILAAAAPASALAGETAWLIRSASSPTNFVAGDETGNDAYVLTVTNDGEASSDESLIEITDTLPAHVRASSISGEDLGNGQALSCSLTPTLHCAYQGFAVAPGDVLRVRIAVDVEVNGASPAVNAASVSGRGAAASVTYPTTISSSAAPFGVSGLALGASNRQAGAHANMSFGFDVDQTLTGGEAVPVTAVKDLSVRLPAGFLAVPTAAAMCSASEAVSSSCPAASAVGVVFASASPGVPGPPAAYSSLIYNTAPQPGAFGVLTFKLAGVLFWVDLSIGPEGGYALTLKASNISEVTGLLSLDATLWGVPARYQGAGPDKTQSGSSFGDPAAGQAAAFLTNSGACVATPQESMVSADSWSEPSVFSQALGEMSALNGCERLSFTPYFAVASDVEQAATPSGYTIDLAIPQPQGAPYGLAEGQIEDATVTLPVGASISLSALGGLEGCTEAQAALPSSMASACPNASTIGTVEARTPLLAHPLDGHLYLAEPYANPTGSLIGVYLIAESAGVSVKVAGAIEADPLTGQVALKLDELPQLLLTDLALHFFGGPRALFTTPRTCGAQTSTGALVPRAEPNSAFNVASSFNVTGCASQFAPQLEALTFGESATGPDDALALVVERGYAEEELRGLQLSLPATIPAALSSIARCGEPQAAQGACPAASRIGSVGLIAGPGPAPASIEGTVYLTGPYEGAPLGLAIVLPVKLGPLDLGTAVARATLQEGPGAGEATLTINPLPRLMDGIPLDVRMLDLELEPGKFAVGSPSCGVFTISGAATGAGGADAALSSVLPPAGCVVQANAPSSTSTTAGSGTPSSARKAREGPSDRYEGKASIADHHGVITLETGEAITCPLGGSVCTANVVVTVAEKPSSASSATRRHRHAKAKTIVIARAKLRVAAGQTVKIALRLDKKGIALLRKRHRLNARVTVTITTPGKPTTTSVRAVTVTAPAHGRRSPKRR